MGPRLGTLNLLFALGFFLISSRSWVFCPNRDSALMRFVRFAAKASRLQRSSNLVNTYSFLSLARSFFNCLLSLRKKHTSWFHGLEIFAIWSIFPPYFWSGGVGGGVLFVLFFFSLPPLLPLVMLLKFVTGVFVLLEIRNAVKR